MRHHAMLKPALSPTAPKPRRPQRARSQQTRHGPTRLPQPSIVIPRSYYRVGNRFGAAETAAIFTILLAALAGLPIVARLGWYPLYLLLLPLLGATTQKLALLMEEAGRGTLFTNRHANHVVGLACGALLGTSLTALAREDRNHVRHWGTDLDHVSRDLSRLGDAARWRLVAYLLLPITGYPFVRAAAARGGLLGDLWSRPTAHGASEGQHDAAVWGRLASFVFAQAGIVLIATGLGRYWPLALAYPASAATLGFFFGRLRTFCEHAPVSPRQGPCTVRTHAPNFVDRVLFYTPNANFHVEHHLYPKIPAANLRLVHRDLAHAGYFDQGMVSPSMLRTVWRGLHDARR